MKKLAIVLVCTFLGGCASITRGTTDDVEIVYEPADAQVVTSLGVRCSASPCNVKASRKSGFTVTATRDGYLPVTVEVITKVSGGGAAGFAGNIVAGGVIGMGVDAATGASKDHYPNPVIIKMQPLDSGMVKPPVPEVPAAVPASSAEGNKPVS